MLLNAKLIKTYNITQAICLVNNSDNNHIALSTLLNN